MPLIQLKRERDDVVLYQCMASSYKEAVEKAVADGVSLAGVDLRGRDLRGGKFTAGDLSSASLEGAWLDAANLNGANLASIRAKDASMTYIQADSVNFTDADCTNVDFDQAVIINSVTDGMVTQGASVSTTIKGGNTTDDLDGGDEDLGA